ERAGEGSMQWHGRAVDVVALHDAEGEPQRKRRVGRDAAAMLLEPPSCDGREALALDFFELGFISLANVASRPVDLLRQPDHRVIRLVERLRIVEQALAFDHVCEPSSRDEFRGTIGRWFASKDTRDNWVVAAEILGEESQRCGQLRAFKGGVDRRWR